MVQHNTSSAPPASSAQAQLDSAQNIALRNVLDAVHGEGYEAENLEDAWGKIIRVQAEIALDPTMGSKATTAAKFLAQALGIAVPNISEVSNPPPELGTQAANELLSFIAAERNQREGAP